jgi:hypothetical protein
MQPLDGRIRAIGLQILEFVSSGNYMATRFNPLYNAQPVSPAVLKLIHDNHRIADSEPPGHAFATQ